VNRLILGAIVPNKPMVVLLIPTLQTTSELYPSHLNMQVSVFS